MKCPFRIDSDKTDFTYAHTSHVREHFADCLGKECAAFYGGTCLRLQPPAYVMRANLTHQELQALRNDLLCGGQIMPYNPEQESVEVTPQWISVTERLPELGQNVLMYFRECQTFVVGFLSEAKGRSPLWCSFTDNEWFTECDNRPDYWMPLPEKPKEAQE